MRWKLVVVVAAGLLIAADKDDSNKAQDKLKGSWKLVSAEQGGDKVDLTKVKDLPSKLTFDGDEKITAVIKGKNHEGTYKLGANKKANAMDIIPGDGPNKGKAMKGIYHLKGGTLKICMDRKKNTERPKEVASKEGSDVMVLVFKRIKEE